jgi:hypothetical protein
MFVWTMNGAVFFEEMNDETYFDNHRNLGKFAIFGNG